MPIITVSGSVSTFVGSSILPSIVYGINSTLYVLSLLSFWETFKTSTNSRKRPIIMAAYLTLIYALSSVHLVTASYTEGNYVAQLVDSYLEKPIPKYPARVDLATSIAFVLLTFFTDGLLLWRCWVLYANCKGLLRVGMWILFLIPSLALIGFGILLIYISAFTGELNPDYLRDVVFIGQPFAIFTTNLTFSLLIVGRLIFHHRRLNKLLGKRHGSQYTNIAAMVVESASINVIFQLFSAISVFGGDWGVIMNSIFDLYFLGQTQAMATILIVYRVAQGKGWTEQTSQEQISQLRFGGTLPRFEEGRGRREGTTGANTIVHFAGWRGSITNSTSTGSEQPAVVITRPQEKERETNL